MSAGPTVSLTKYMTGTYEHRSEQTISEFGQLEIRNTQYGNQNAILPY